MSQIKKEVYPVIYKVIGETEIVLSQLVGSRVKLKMEVDEGQLTPLEANKLRLQQLVCTEFNVSWADIVSPSRRDNIPDARKAYCFLVSKILKQPVTVTGKELNRHHSSVIHLRTSCKELIEVNDPIKIKVFTIQNDLYESIH